MIGRPSPPAPTLNPHPIALTRPRRPGLGAAARWKASMARHSASVFAERSEDLAAFVYGKRAVAGAGGEDEDDDGDDGGGAKGLGDVGDGEESDGSGGSDDDLFRLKRPGGGAGGGSGGGQQAKARGRLEAVDGERERGPAVQVCVTTASTTCVMWHVRLLCICWIAP